MLSLDAMLAPVRPDAPAGEDLSFSAELDAIAQARQEDDPSLEQGAWQAPLKEADWALVAARCSELLATRSKDLQLAVWLAEACARRGDGAALAETLMLLAGLCERYWDCLHPQPDEQGQERRIGNLCWLAARLPGWLASLPPHAALAPALQALEAQLDLRLGAEGPSFAAARALVHALPPQAAPVSGSALQDGSRAQAIAQLRAVAAWFRQHEPHSPAAYLAERAARWAEQDLAEWLRAVVKDSATLAQLEETLGLD